MSSRGYAQLGRSETRLPTEGGVDDLHTVLCAHECVCGNFETRAEFGLKLCERDEEFAALDMLANSKSQITCNLS